MEKLGGKKEATLEGAKHILKEARKEAKSGDRLRRRQAAEKVWLAVTTAADALVGGTSKASQVFDVFKKAWKAPGLQVAEDIQGALHGGCFYSDVGCDTNFIDRHASRLGKLLSVPENKLRRRMSRH